MVFLKCNEGDTEIKVHGSDSQIMSELNVGLKHFFQKFESEELKRKMIVGLLAQMYEGFTTGYEFEENEKLFEEAKEEAKKILADPFVKAFRKMLNQKDEFFKNVLKEFVSSVEDKLGDLDDEE